MAKAKSTATKRRTAVEQTEEVKAAIAAGKQPYTVTAGIHREPVVAEDGSTSLSPPYKRGDVVYSDSNLAERFPEKFVAGACGLVEGRAVESPGLGERVTDQANNGGYELYQKGGVVYAYTPGDYGAPVSGPLIDLVAAEEWVEANPLA